MSAALALFTKAPVPGQVKTRMVPPLSHDEAAAVAWACLDSSLRRFVPAVPVPFTLFLDGEADAPLRALAAELSVPIVAQAAGDLGARLEAAFRNLRAAGATRTLAIGSDSPTLDPVWIGEAVSALDENDVVIGPAEDGGYYLIGVRGDAAGIFREIPWSTREVALMTRERAGALGLSVHSLPSWYDVDDLPSLARAMGDPRSPLHLPVNLPALST